MPPKTRSRRTRSPSPLPVSRGRSVTPVLPSNLQVYTRGRLQPAPARRSRQSARGRARGARGVSRRSPSPSPPPAAQPAPRGKKNRQKKTLSTKHGRNPKENMPLTKNFQADGKF